MIRPSNIVYEHDSKLLYKDDDSNTLRWCLQEKDSFGNTYLESLPSSGPEFEEFKEAALLWLNAHVKRHTTRMTFDPKCEEMIAIVMDSAGRKKITFDRTDKERVRFKTLDTSYFGSEVTLELSDG